MADTIIADWPPRDGRDWDCQCARCGSSTGREDCQECGGEGVIDPPWDDLGEPVRRCHVCRGRGGWEACLSGAAWCDAHPMPDREDVQRGKVEWFVVQRGGDRG